MVKGWLKELEDWRIGGLEGWTIGGLENSRIEGLEEWRIGGLEDWSIGGLDGFKVMCYVLHAYKGRRIQILMARALTADAGTRLWIIFFVPFSVFKWALVDCLGKLYLINLETLSVLMCS